MKDLKFTPGPWKVRYFRDKDWEQGFFVEAPKTDPDMPYNIEILSEDSGGYPAEQRHADAILISQAPDMYALIKEAKEAIEIHFAKGGIESLEPFKTVLSKINKLFNKLDYGNN